MALLIIGIILLVLGFGVAGTAGTVLLVIGAICAGFGLVEVLPRLQ